MREKFYKFGATVTCIRNINKADGIKVENYNFKYVKPIANFLLFYIRGQLISNTVYFIALV